MILVKEIVLTQGKVTIVDDEDFEYLNQWKWCAHKEGNIFYAVRSDRNNNGKRITIRMHREILKNEIKEGFIPDHKNGNGLDNRRENLRMVTNRQNTQNRHDKKSSKYPGVYWLKHRQKWRALIRDKSNKQISLGLWTNEYDAFLAYKNAVWALTGQNVI